VAAKAKRLQQQAQDKHSQSQQVSQQSKSLSLAQGAGVQTTPLAMVNPVVVALELRQLNILQG
jgi:hypothetical protein